MKKERLLLERPRSLTDLVAEELRLGIINGQIELGSNLSEARIANDLGVSRTPVREALNKLETDGLLIVEPQRGSRVFSLESVDLKKICDARMYLEMAALEESFKSTETQLAGALNACVAEMRASLAANDTGHYQTLDTEFHQHFFTHCGNEYLADASKIVGVKMAALRNRLFEHAHLLEKSMEEHAQIAKAVSNGDQDCAKNWLAKNIGRQPGSYWFDLSVKAKE